MPIVVTNLFQTAYNLADTFWLGQYSTDALAAISFAFPMVFLLISLGMGISVAGACSSRSTPARARPGGGVRRLADGDVRGDRLGGPRRRRLLLRRRVPRVDGRVGGRVALAASYMEVISLGLVAMFGFAVFIALMRGYGDTITPMLVMFGSVVLNIALDPFLIFGWGRSRAWDRGCGDRDRVLSGAGACRRAGDHVPRGARGPDQRRRHGPRRELPAPAPPHHPACRPRSRGPGGRSR